MTGHGARMAARRLLVIGGGQQTYGQPDAPIGIGRAIAQLAAREGATVAVADIDLAAADLTVSALRREGHVAEAIVADSSDPAQVATMFEEAITALGGLDALAINTGTTAGNGFEATTSADWDRVMAINVRSHFLALQAAWAAMTTGGSIVLTSSTAYRAVRTTNTPVYAASKAALEGLCSQAAKDFATRCIRVNIVMPGLIDTSLGRLASAVFPDRDKIAIPLGRQGTAWDVSAGAVFLLSDDSAYITNVVLPIDGGLSSIH